MPVYIRKNVSFTPPSLDRIPVEQDDDYVQDPDQIEDRLPQPFRMIDKVINQIFEDIWEVIAKREEARLEEARKVRPPCYDYALTIEGIVPGSTSEKQNVSLATCMTDSVDGKYVFVGLPSGLIAIDAMSQQILSSWEDESAEITYLKAHIIGEQAYVLVSIDDMGVSRIFSFANSKLYLMRTMNEHKEDSDPHKILASKIEASKHADYVGLVLEIPSSREMWLEVHRIPRDNWVHELDNLGQAMKKAAEKKEESEAKEKEGESTTEQEEAELPTAVPPADTQESPQQTPSLYSSSSYSRPRTYGSRHYSKRQSRPPSGGDTTGDQVVHQELEIQRDTGSDHRFSQAQLIMRAKPPVSVTGNPNPNVFAACQKIDTGDVVGTGQNHVLTQAHLDLRQSVFTHLHEHLLKYLPKEEEANMTQLPIFHFMTPGRMIPQGLEQQNLIDRPTTLALWWPGSTNLLQYSLLKTSKDVEFKPDLVWPCTCKITDTVVSEDTSLIAIGLQNGNVIIWDRYMGMQRGVVNVSSSFKIVQMEFLDPSVYPQEDNDYPPYPTKKSTYLLVLCGDGAMYLVNTGLGMTAIPTCISPPAENDDEMLTVMQPIDGLPDVMLTILRKGTVQLRQVLDGKVLCEIRFPPSHDLTAPWDPLVAFGGQGQMFYIKGTKKQEDEDDTDTDPVETGHQPGTLFVYQFRSFPTLDEHWKKERDLLPIKIHTTIDTRVEALLKERIAQQGLRKSRMQDRWTALREEIGNIYRLKDAARAKADGRPAFIYQTIQNPYYETPGSVGWVPLIDE